MFFVRWLPTFLGFPAGGFLAIQTVGSVEGPVTAALGGLVAGAVIGTAQWLALRSRGVGPRWAIHTAVGMAAGSAIAATLTGAATTVGALAFTGLITGAFVGAAQATQLRRGRRLAGAWTVLVGVAWATGWLVSANVIVDAERGYFSFGASGALLVTMATGLTLRWIFADGRDPQQSVGTSTTTAPVAAAHR
jgi:hypothetical protein